MIIRRAGFMGAAYGVLLQSALAVAQPGLPDPNTALLSEHVINLSLAEAVALGMRSNYSIRSLKLQRLRERFDLRVAQDRFNPQLKLSATHMLSRGSADRGRASEAKPSVSVLGEYGTRLELGWKQQLNASKNTGELQSEGMELTVIQPLLRGAGKDVTTAPLRLARLTGQINRLTAKASVSQTLYDIISAYHGLLKSQSQAALASKALARAVSLLEVNTLLIASGRVAEFETVQIEADIASQQLALEEAGNQLESSRLSLLKLLALDLSTSIHASGTLEVTRPEVDRTAALELAQRNQPQFLATLLQSEVASINLLVAQDQARWDLSWVAGVNQLREQGTRGGSRSWDSYAGLKLEIPIADMALRQGKVHARTQVEQQALIQQEARMDLERQVTDSVRGLNTQWRQLEISQRLTDLSRRKLAIETDKLNVGRSSNFQIISFESDLRAAEEANLNARISYLDARARRDVLLGVLLENWEISLEDF